LSQSPPCIRNRVETIELTRRLEPMPDEEIVGLFPGDILAKLINVAGVLLSLPRPSVSRAIRANHQALYHSLRHCCQSPGREYNRVVKKPLVVRNEQRERGEL
jgi:hypothetical protein